MADTLMKHKQGDMLCIQGAATPGHCTGTDGEDRTILSVNVESIVSARTTRPGGTKRTITILDQTELLFDDPLPNVS
ncbi:unnamed protein product [marine sediment metagenome]|uniref:Uncharacterized protein n=1 Tax=marine sediment metagenome TaxID=412755 RepID=X1DBG6_9ZZZZ